MNHVDVSRVGQRISHFKQSGRRCWVWPGSSPPDSSAVRNVPQGVQREASNANVAVSAGDAAGLDQMVVVCMLPGPVRWMPAWLVSYTVTGNGRPRARFRSGCACRIPLSKRVAWVTSRVTMLIWAEVGRVTTRRARTRATSRQPCRQPGA